MKRYDSYKNSGVEWIGEVPEHWEVCKIKRLSVVKRGASPRPIENPIYFDDNGQYAWVRISDVTDSKKYLYSTTQKLSKLGASLSVKMHSGEIFLSIAGTVGKPIITKIDCCIHDGFVWFPNLKLEPEFLYYVFMSGRPYLGLGKLGTQLNLNTETVGYISIPIPEGKEIIEIVSYLDSRCGEVDKVISTQEKRISLLQELKQSIITHAVTKGLNPDVKMKDSGIEWIGEVPEHWVIMRVKDLLRLLTDYDANGSFADIAKNCNINNGNPYAWMVRATDLENNRIGIVDGNNYCDKKTYEYLSKSSLSENDILLAKRGDIGKSYLVPFCNDPMTLAPNTYLLLTDKKKVNNKCLFYYFQSYVGAEILRLLNKSTTLGALYKDDVKSINVPIAPLLEQQEIASYLDKRCAQIDASICKAQREIELLQEYKQSLITEVVTGKRKVC